jgi:hypothetical protein
MAEEADVKSLRRTGLATACHAYPGLFDALQVPVSPDVPPDTVKNRNSLILQLSFDDSWPFLRDRPIPSRWLAC